VVTVAVLLFGMGVSAVATVGVLNAIFVAIFIAVMLRQSTGVTLRPSFSGLRAVAKAGLPFLLLEATVILYQQVDTLVMSFLVDERELGWYGVASMLFGTLLFVPTVLMTSLFPMAARLAKES